MPVRPNVPGTEISWAKNPQFALDIFGFQGEIAIDIILSTPVKEEIFICVMTHGEAGKKLPSFDKKMIVKSGGASMLRSGRITSLTATVMSPGKYVIIPSTWKVDMELTFVVSVAVRGFSGYIEARLSEMD